MGKVHGTQHESPRLKHGMVTATEARAIGLISALFELSAASRPKSDFVPQTPAVIGIRGYRIAFHGLQLISPSSFGEEQERCLRSQTQ
jgi:hypothetical protein